jgi:hypothetical protein
VVKPATYGEAHLFGDLRASGLALAAVYPLRPSTLQSWHGGLGARAVVPMLLWGNLARADESVVRIIRARWKNFYD